jgi:serine/threonine protein kinase/Tfp pilus assembly protein PilF
MIEPNAVLAGRYRVKRELGRGGMGAVYEAEDLRFRNRVAVKEAFFGSPELAKAFEREARLLRSLKHQALPRVIDYFREAGSWCLVMDYIPGEDLWASLARRGAPFPFDQLLEWLDQVLDALEYLHGHSPPIVHRDIKPHNLKLTPEGEVFLLDFGLSKGSVAEMSQATGGASVRGYTPHFAPLEQLHNRGTGPASDFYSLAATAYCLLTGKLPPDAGARAAASLAGTADPLRLVSELNSLVPAAVATELHRALRQNPTERPRTAAEFRAALRAAAAGGRASWSPPTGVVAEDADAVTTLINFRRGDAPTQVAGSDRTSGAGSGEKSRSREVQDLYDAGTKLLNRFFRETACQEDLDRAVSLFQQAVDLNPQFAPAHAALGSCFVNYALKGFSGSRDYREEAAAAVERALEINPSAVEPRVTLAYVYLAAGKKAQARAIVEALRREAPNSNQFRHIYVTLLRLDGRLDEALAELRRQARVSPDFLVDCCYNMARIHLYRGDYDAAEAEFGRAKTAGPGHLSVDAFRAQLLYYTGRLDEAADLFESVTRGPGARKGFLPLLGVVYSAQGLSDRALGVVDEDVVEAANADHDIAYWLASLYAVEGRRESALIWLRRAVELGNENLSWFERDPNWTGLHGDEEYEALLTEVRARLTK